MATMKTFTFALPDDLKLGLQLVRDRDGVSEAEQIRRAIGMWLESKDARPQAALKRSAGRGRSGQGRTRRSGGDN